MRAACRNYYLHHAKRNLNPLQAPGRRTPVSSRIPVTRVMKTAAPSNQTTHPAFSSQTFSCGSLAPLIGAAYTYWFIGAKEEAKGAGPLERSSLLRAAEEPQGSGLSPKITASHELATCRGPAANPLGWRSGRRPDFIGAVQHPRIERRLIIPSCPSMPSRNSPLLAPPACNDLRPTRANGDRENCVRYLRLKRYELLPV
jgi:hypothetical protein